MFLLAILLTILSLVGVFYSRNYQKRNLRYLSILVFSLSLLYIISSLLLLGSIK